MGTGMLQLTHISKRFGPALAIDNVDFEVRPGEVHALVGENGAGKSTLINIMTGVLRPDKGHRLLGGLDLTDQGAQYSRAKGIVAVCQEFSLIPSLTVTENLFLGKERTRRSGYLKVKEMRAHARSVLSALNFEVREDMRIEQLSRAEQQMVEIAKALDTRPRILILDEPTASLTEVEAEKLYSTVIRLRAEGVGIVYVSHRMPEIWQLADRITVLRNGRHVNTIEKDQTHERQVIEWMAGRKADHLYPAITSQPGAIALQTRSLSVEGGPQSVSIDVRFGEVVGVAGLVGCGKSEVIRACFGLEPISGGSIELRGLQLSRLTPRSVLQHRMCYFPSDRGAEGLAIERSIRENTTMAALDVSALSRGGVLRRRRERVLSHEVLRRLKLYPLNTEASVASLSGGNRQKVLLARGLMRDIDIFLFDEPTVGIDIGSKFQIYELICELAQGGAAVVVVSSELPEVVNLSHRLYVMHAGRVVAHLPRERCTEHDALQYFFGENAAYRTEQTSQSKGGIPRVE